jgi:peptide deformylase
MEIVQYQHPALRWKSKSIAHINTKLTTIIREMFDLMYEAKGIGLAANQVALPFRFFIINVTGDAQLKEEEHVFINPEISDRKGSAEAEEGCLSMPELYGDVRRAEQITVDAFDLEGHGFQMELDDMPARVVQHETDHLDGILFPDRMSESARREIDSRLSDFTSLFRQQQRLGKYASEDEIEQQLREIEQEFA